MHRLGPQVVCILPENAAGSKLLPLGCGHLTVTVTTKGITFFTRESL